MNKLLGLAAAGAILLSVGAQAAETAYTDKAAFTAAAGLSQTETFGTATIGNFASVGGVYNATFDGFKVTGQNNGNYVGISNGPTASSGPNYAIPTNFYDGSGTNKYLTWANITGGTISLTINFNKATTAFGFDYFDTDYSDSYQVNVPGGNLYNSPPFALAVGQASTGFFGLVSSTPFTSVFITDKYYGGYISDEGIDNLVTNGAGSVVGGVPEPTTWALLVAGFGFVGATARRRRSAVVAA